MIRRLPAPLALAVAAVLAAAWTPPSRAAEIVPSFRLSNTGTTPVGKVDLSVVPPGTVVAPADGTSPLKVQDGYKGFDLSQLKVLLGGGTFSDGPQKGQPLKLLRLDFGPGGLLPGDGNGLNFTLNVDKAFQGDVQLMLPADAKSLSLVNTTPKPTPPEPPPTPQPAIFSILNNPADSQIPEPASLALWGSLAGIGLLAARARRAGRPARA